MDNEIKTWLFDISSAISEIDGFFEDGKKVFEIQARHKNKACS